MIKVDLYKAHDVSITQRRFPDPSTGCDPFVITSFEFHMEDGSKFTTEIYNDGLDKFAVNDDRS